MVGLELGTSATLDPGAIGVWPDDGHGARSWIQRQHRPVATSGHGVGQHHDAGCRQFPGQRTGLGSVHAALGCLGGHHAGGQVVQHSGASGHTQHVAGHGQHHVGGYVAGVHGVGQPDTEMLHRPGHLPVQARQRRLGSAVGAQPVRHHGAVEAPFAAQHVGQQPGVLAAVGAVEAVVGAHDHPHAGLGHCRLKRHEIQLAQRPLRHLG